MMDYKIEVELNESGILYPYKWVLYEWTGTKYWVRSCGCSVTPNQAWEDAYQSYQNKCMKS